MERSAAHRAGSIQGDSSAVPDAPKRRTPGRRPSEEDITELQRLYEQVPAHTKVVRDWTTPEGVAFIERAAKLRDSGVPAAWIADGMGIDDRKLLLIIDRRRKPFGRARPAQQQQQQPPRPGGQQ